MKKGDYVIVTDNRGSFSGEVVKVNKNEILVQCRCCFAPKKCKKDDVKTAEKC